MEWLGVDLRRLGNALLAFGIVGMVVAGIVAVGLISGAIAARNLDERLAADQARLVATLDRVDATIAQTVTTVDNAGATLTTTSETLRSAQDVLGDVGATAAELSTALDFTILGNQPLAGAAARFGELSVQVRGFEDKAGALADNLAVNAGDTRALAAQIDALRSDVTLLGERIATFEGSGELASLLVGGLALLGVLAVWLALAAAGCAFAGWRIRSTMPPVVALPATEEPAAPPA